MFCAKNLFIFSSLIEIHMATRHRRSFHTKVTIFKNQSNNLLPDFYILRVARNMSVFDFDKSANSITSVAVIINFLGSFWQRTRIAFALNHLIPLVILYSCNLKHFEKSKISRMFTK